MNILQFQEDQQQLFADDDSHHFSIEEETQELINQVFNQKYEPVYNPMVTKVKEEEIKKHKKQVNSMLKHKDGKRGNQQRKVYQNYDDVDVSESFKEFLVRAQERIERRDHWLDKERTKKEEMERKTLKDIPDILRGSREKVMPIYQRCIELQKSKEKNLEVKRIQKYRKQVQKAQSFTYHPAVNNNNRQKRRTFDEYITQKQIWQQEKQQELEKKRVAYQVKKLSECTFTPKLISKYNKPNPRIIPGERVEERLLRSLQKSQENEVSMERSYVRT